MVSVGERLELAKLCSSRNCSKAIHILDSLLLLSCSIQDICNRAFCYSQLELHKHIVKDCDRALERDPSLLQAHILKGNAFLALGQKEDALHVWEEGYAQAVHKSADIKQLLEVEDLLASTKQKSAVGHESVACESSTAIKLKSRTKVGLMIYESDAIDSFYDFFMFETEVAVNADSTIGSSDTTLLTINIGNETKE